MRRDARKGDRQEREIDRQTDTETDTQRDGARERKTDRRRAPTDTTLFLESVNLSIKPIDTLTIMYQGVPRWILAA